jgi:dienelactone hydrolase
MALEAGFGHDLQDALTRRFQQADERRTQAMAKLKTAADARRYVQRVRRAFAACFPAMPTQRCPLTPRITGTIDSRSVRIEKVMFQSRPGFWVTANLYLPRRAAGRCPTVLISSGHYPDAKAMPRHQSTALGLAEMGYVVLAYDPLGQGERFQYLVDETSARQTVLEHITAGNQMWLTGDFLGSWRAWDAIRAIDYVLTRPEVDPRRIGMHGCSGGGTLTTFTSMLDARLAMIAPSCYGMPYVAQQEMEAPADSEQNPWGPVARGLDFADMFIARAPRPTLLMVQRHDFFSLRGNQRLFEQVRRVYALLGAPDQVQLHLGEGTHGVFGPDMLAMFRFFNRIAGVDCRARLPRQQPRPASDLFVTPRGQIEHGKSCRRVCEFTADRAADMARQRGRVSPRALPRRIAQALQLPDRHDEPRWQLLKPRGGDDARPFVTAWRYLIYPEPGIRNILRYWSARDGGKELHHYSTPPVDRCRTLYLPHLASVEDVRGGHARGEPDLYTLDMRGIGEMRSAACYASEDFLLYYDADFFHASAHYLLGEVYLGKRVHDTLTALDLLRSLGMKAIHLQGRGLGAIVAALAAVLHPAVRRVTLFNSPDSFDAMARAFIQNWPASVLPFNVLSHFDLPDCYAALRGKRLRRINSWNSQMQPMKNNT